MTQKATVLAMLRNAGERGVRSDAFYREFLGRGVAHEISSEKEGKYTRYKLVGQLQRGRDRQVRGAGCGEDVRDGASASKSGGTSNNPRRNTQPARLFDLPSRSAFTDDEMAA